MVRYSVCYNCRDDHRSSADNHVYRQNKAARNTSKRLLKSVYIILRLFRESLILHLIFRSQELSPQTYCHSFYRFWKNLPVSQ